MNPEKLNKLLFVYGTLRVGTRHLLARYLASRGRYMGPASCRGRLYDLGGYPALVTSSVPGDAVIGDLYRVNNRDVWRRLDIYEGCLGKRGAGREYQRVLIPVMRNGTEAPVEAWVYLYRHPVRGLRRILSGDWLRRSRFLRDLNLRRNSS